MDSKAKATALDLIQSYMKEIKSQMEKTLDHYGTELQLKIHLNNITHQKTLIYLDQVIYLLTESNQHNLQTITDKFTGKLILKTQGAIEKNGTHDNIELIALGRTLSFLIEIKGGN